ncbi:MAG: hypothetical protein VX284_04405 [Candidatus Neomarinimicrobiota bacterium]|nr:hypothetical protein [Candidatus Neomarinimicrobiota bacterium]
MRLISRVLINTVILVNTGFGLGTQFLSVPFNAIDLAFGCNPLLGKVTLNNPALLTASPQGINLHMSYGSWLSNVSASSFALASKFSRGTIGLQLRHMGLNDLELRTTTPTDYPIATFGSSALSIDGSYSQSFGGLKAGASLKYIFVQLHTEKITGYAVDAGITHSISKNIQMGVSALNLGIMNKSDTYNQSLPMRLLSAISYQFSRSKWDHTVCISAEKSSFVNGPIFGVANETRYNKLDIRFGSHFSDKVTIFSGGFGIRLGILDLHYGIQVGSQHLGIPQMVDLSLRLP